MTTILVAALSASSFAMGPKSEKKKEADQKKQEVQQIEQNERAILSPGAQTKKDYTNFTSSGTPDVLTPTTDRMRADAKAALDNLEGLGEKQLPLEAFVAVLQEDLERWKSEESEKSSLVRRRAIEVAEQLFQQYSSLEKKGANNESSRDEQPSELDSRSDSSDVIKLLQNDQKCYQALKKMIEEALQFRTNGCIEEAKFCDEKANEIVSFFKLKNSSFDLNCFRGSSGGKSQTGSFEETGAAGNVAQVKFFPFPPFAEETPGLSDLRLHTRQDVINKRSHSCINARSVVMMTASGAALFYLYDLYEWYLHHLPSTTSS